MGFNVSSRRRSGSSSIKSCKAGIAQQNHYSVCLTFRVHKNEFYLIDVLHQRRGYPVFIG